MYFVAAVSELQISSFSNVNPNLIRRSYKVLTLSFVVFVTKRTFTSAARSLKQMYYFRISFDFWREWTYLSKADTEFPTAVSSTWRVPLRSMRAPSILPESVLDIMILLHKFLEQNLSEMTFNSMKCLFCDRANQSVRCWSVLWL